jgi:hypothetical protein
MYLGTSFRHVFGVGLLIGRFGLWNGLGSLSSAPDNRGSSAKPVRPVSTKLAVPTVIGDHPGSSEITTQLRQAAARRYGPAPAGRADRAAPLSGWACPASTRRCEAARERSVSGCWPGLREEGVVPWDADWELSRVHTLLYQRVVGAWSRGRKIARIG